MKGNASSLRQRLWRDYQALGRTLRAMASKEPMTSGSFYLMRRKCGKPTCRCARGRFHPTWVLTRSEAGRHKLYGVPADQRARVRQLAAAWRTYQRARARWVKETAALLALGDRLAQIQTVAWPARRAKKSTA